MSFAQKKWPLILRDIESKEPISFASITGDSGDFTYSNIDGSFEISASDSIIISHINYGEHIISIKTSFPENTIYIAQKTIDLKEVVVIAETKKRKAYKVGNLLKRSNLTFNISEKTQIVLYIPNDKYTVGSTVLSIEIPLFGRKDETYNRLIIRPKLYSVNPLNTMPHAELIHNEELVELEDINSKYYSVNLEKHNISLPEGGIYVGFELIGAINEKGELIRSNHFSRKVGLQGDMSKKFKGFKTLLMINNSEWINITNDRNVRFFNKMDTYNNATFAITVID